MGSFWKSGLQIINSPAIFKQMVQFSKPIQGPGGNASPLWRLAPQPAISDPNHCFQIFDDFLSYTTAHEGWVDTLTDSGTNTAGDARGGILTMLPSDGSVADNDEAYIHTQNEIFRLLTGDEIFAEVKLAITEGNTDDANVIFTLTDQAAGANTLLDNGGGPPANHDGISIFKVDGGTVWQAEVSNGASQTTNTNIGAVTSATYVRLGFHANPSKVDFYVDGNIKATLTTNIPTGAEMRLRIGVKNGSANQETLAVDWVKAIQTRIG